MSFDSARPELRIGDAEREAAATALSDHFAAGRLTHEEFDDRLERAWQARTGADLSQLFADLPPARDQSPVQSVPATGGDTVVAHTACDAMVWGGWPPPPDARRPRHVPVAPLAVLMIILSVTTGLPWVVFVLGAVLLFFIARARRRRAAW